MQTWQGSIFQIKNTKALKETKEQGSQFHIDSWYIGSQIFSYHVYKSNDTSSDNSIAKVSDVFITVAVTCRKCSRFHILWEVKTKQSNPFLSLMLSKGAKCVSFYDCGTYWMHVSVEPKDIPSWKAFHCGQISILKAWIWLFRAKFRKIIILILYCMWSVSFVRVKIVLSNTYNPP